MRTSYTPRLTDGHTLAHYRERIFYWFSIFTSSAIVPFAVLAFMNGYPALGTVLFSLVLVFIVDAAFMHWGRKPPVPPVAVSGLVMVSLGFAIVGGGVKGVVWGYPAIMLFQFLLNRWAANLVSLVIVVVISGFSYWYLGPSVTLRVAASLLLTFAFTALFMNVILELQRRLEEHAIIDPLTGVYNRRRFDADLEHAIALKAGLGISSSLLLIDIDRFKAINDELGHAEGDRVLRDVVVTIREAIRPSDSIFRLGGEEFAVLMPNSNAELAGKVAEKVRVAVSNAALVADRRVTVSIGFDEFDIGEAPAKLLHRCDVALYRAKDSGRNRVESGRGLETFGAVKKPDHSAQS